jgi:hypothetical protein
MPGLPDGKAAGVPCPHLTETFVCGLWGNPDRPKVCAEFRPEVEFCGHNRDDALQILSLLEQTS